MEETQARAEVGFCLVVVIDTAKDKNFGNRIWNFDLPGEPSYYFGLRGFCDDPSVFSYGCIQNASIPIESGLALILLKNTAGL